MKKKHIFTLTFITSMVLSGCANNPFIRHNSANANLPQQNQPNYNLLLKERSISQSILNKSIEHTAKINIRSLDPSLIGHSRILVSSYDNNVLLVGEVPSKESITQVDNTVSAIPGVKKVYNALTISVPKTYSYTLHDDYILSKLKARILSNPDIKYSQLKMINNGGVIYVMGNLNQQQYNTFITLVNQTAGIIDVVSLINTAQ